MELKILKFVFFLFTTILHSQVSDGLISYYPFNGDSNDNSGLSNNGIVDGPFLTTDRNNLSNSAYSFDGNDDIIRVLGNDNNNLGENFSIMAWFNPFSIKSQTILRKNSGETFNKILGAYNLTLSQTNDYIFSVSTLTESIQLRLNGYKTNEWQHIMGVKKGNQLSLYVNGEKVDSKVISGAMANDTSSLFIGTRIQIPANTFHGVIDEIKLYNKALTEEEISGVLSKSEYLLNSKLSLYPNPTDGEINFKLSNPLDNKVTYQIFTELTVLVKKGSLNKKSSIDINDLNPGIYFLKINDGNKLITKKIIKK